MDAVVAHSEQSIRQGSTSFRTAARLFGRSLREDVWQFYAWCRHCDDEIDGQDHGHDAVALSSEERQARLQRLRRLTEAALRGEQMSDAAFVAFQRVALRHEIPSQWPLEMLDGFAMDVEARRYERLDETLQYCWGVAGVVGVMMAQIMGVRDAEVLKRAQDLGLAFQLTNICRDLREDAVNGRVYLPAELLAAARAPTTAAGLQTPDAQTFEVVRTLLTLAEDYYDSARVGVRALPFRGALAVAAARGVYREIGRRILRQGPGAMGTRMSVPRPVMLWLVLRGVGVALWSRLERVSDLPPRPELWSRL